ncbi:hypothetical protein, partial [Mycobacterium tuberculosis]|uniref:hypothetical protein n=1 Tax=Mycobacterium tuberculosis TaxID=1773 RepID=UPI000508E21B
MTAVTIAEGEVAVGAVAAVTGEPAGPPFAAGPADTLDSVLAKEVPRQTAGPALAAVTALRAGPA